MGGWAPLSQLNTGLIWGIKINETFSILARNSRFCHVVRKYKLYHIKFRIFHLAPKPTRDILRKDSQQHTFYGIEIVLLNVWLRSRIGKFLPLSVVLRSHTIIGFKICPRRTCKTTSPMRDLKGCYPLFVRPMCWFFAFWKTRRKWATFFRTLCLVVIGVRAWHPKCMTIVEKNRKPNLKHRTNYKVLYVHNQDIQTS